MEQYFIFSYSIINNEKKVMQLTTNATAIQPVCITRLSTSVASCEAPKRRHRTSARAVLARRTPWSSLSLSSKNTKHNYF